MRLLLLTVRALEPLGMQAPYLDNISKKDKVSCYMRYKRGNIGYDGNTTYRRNRLRVDPAQFSIYNYITKKIDVNEEEF